MMRLNLLRNSCYQPRFPNGPEMVHKSSLYHFTMALWSGCTVISWPPIQL